MKLFKDKNVVFTGTLNFLKRTEAVDFIISQGGMVRGSVSHKTDILIVGHRQINLFWDDTHSKKQIAALERIREGQEIQIINEDAFFELFQKASK